MVTPAASRDLPGALATFRRLQGGALLLSPSIMTGHDFPYRDAEYQILAKVPFPDTRSPIMQARLAVDSTLRQTVALKALMQAAGRIVRAVDDAGETFIVDGHACWFLRRVRRELPRWFVAAIRITDQLPDPPARFTARVERMDALVLSISTRLDL
jgi:Rad3-related DNA helicase